jgi:hypothetical protein
MRGGDGREKLIHARQLQRSEGLGSRILQRHLCSNLAFVLN